MLIPRLRSLTLLLAGVVQTVAAQPMAPRTAGPAPAPRVGRAATLTTPPLHDGRLDEAVWREAPVLTDFVQREPYEGTPVTERTEVRLLTDGTALYVGAWLYDREPDLIVPSETIRDVTLTNSDYFAIILDTYLDRQNGFLFGTTPSGIEHDAQVIREGEGGGVFQAGQNRAQAG
ncbi:MAG: carbohydrate binding family 9 domain-containing protein, partial [Gemmatimonadaceae bacterium]